MTRLESRKSEIVLRRTRVSDREKVIDVEAKSTPNLRYLPKVFDMFVSDEAGEFSVAEIDGNLVACGKFTIMPDGSAWLETIRVIPACQGHGIGKALARAVIAEARTKGYQKMRLDTIESMQAARGLYLSLGFKTIEAYCHNPLDNPCFMELEL